MVCPYITKSSDSREIPSWSSGMELYLVLTYWKSELVEINTFHCMGYSQIILQWELITPEDWLFN